MKCQFASAAVLDKYFCCFFAFRGEGRDDTGTVIKKEIFEDGRELLCVGGDCP